jgi:hypothetical protein
MNSKILQRTIVLIICLSARLLTLGQALASQQKLNFTSFTIKSNKNKIRIDWATDKKVPANYFEVERSSDGIEFTTVALVLGPDPKQTGCDCYQCFDKPDFKSKKYFYRLKHVGAAGQVELSETKMLAVNR